MSLSASLTRTTASHSSKRSANERAIAHRPEPRLTIIDAPIRRRKELILRPFARALLHKCSMLGRPARHQHLARRRRLGLVLGGASRRSAAVRGQRGDRRGGLLCPRVLYVRRSELKEISPDAVDVSSFDEAKRVASVAEEERRIIEAERRRLGLEI